MAASFSPNDALVYAKEMVKGEPLDRLQNPILQDSSSLLWMAAPWSWTLGVTAPIVVTASQQDQTTFTTPADFLYFVRGWVQDEQGATEVQPVTAQPLVNGLVSPPVYFSKQSSTSIRFQALIPAETTNGGARHFTSVYKKIAPDLSLTYDTPGALVMDDSYFWVYREITLYFAYKYSDDVRAGSATTMIAPDGKIQVQYSGQMGVMHAAIEFMRQTENLTAGYDWAGSRPATKLQ